MTWNLSLTIVTRLRIKGPLGFLRKNHHEIHDSFRRKHVWYPDSSFLCATLRLFSSTLPKIIMNFAGWRRGCRFEPPNPAPRRRLGKIRREVDHRYTKVGRGLPCRRWIRTVSPFNPRFSANQSFLSFFMAFNWAILETIQLWFAQKSRLKKEKNLQNTTAKNSIICTKMVTQFFRFMLSRPSLIILGYAKCSRIRATQRRTA